MPKESTLASLDQFLAQYAPLVGVLYAEAMCERWGLSRETFAEGLRRSAAKRFGGAQPDPGEVEAYLKSLHLADLPAAVLRREELSVGDSRVGVAHHAAGMDRLATRDLDAGDAALLHEDSLHPSPQSDPVGDAPHRSAAAPAPPHR